ncbi:MAG: NUMOD4 motif-containing HNH endonuclease [Aeriscardovia sp.]|nr:NUMOD4 motif-containing HNH endonuclease [Aeriscardovia sp.]
MNNENGQSAAKQILTKPIKGWEDKYSITNDGRVYSYFSNKYLKPVFDKDGYATVNLSRDNVVRKYKIHRLVAETFVDNPNNKQEVNHKDFNRSNNWFENLEWVTQEENDDWSKLHGHNGRYDIQKAYTFTNVFNGNSFTILGFKNVLKQFGGSKRNFIDRVQKYANTGAYIKYGRFKGLRIDTEDLKVQRLVSNDVPSSEGKCGTSQVDEDIV